MIIKKLNQLEKEQITNNPNLYKKSLLSNYKLKKCLMFSYSELKYGQKTTKFVHKDLLKFYFILSGKCHFNVNNKHFFLKKNEMIWIEPGERYYLFNKDKNLIKHIYAGYLI